MTTISTIGNCKDCGRGMYSQKAWKDYPVLHRPGYARVSGGGLCDTCGSRARRATVAEARLAPKPKAPPREPDKSGLPVVAKVGEIPVHLRRKAVRTIASHAVDATEAAELLDMLGLTAGDGLEVAR